MYAIYCIIVFISLSIHAYAQTNYDIHSLAGKHKCTILKPSKISNDPVNSTILIERFDLSPFVVEKYNLDDLITILIEVNPILQLNPLDRLTVRIPSSITIENSGVTNSTYELYDDGTHGDETAGDGIYTRTGFKVKTSAYGNSSFYEKIKVTPTITLFYPDGNSIEYNHAEELMRSIYVVKPIVFNEEIEILVDEPAFTSTSYMAAFNSGKSKYFSSGDVQSGIKNGMKEFYKYHADEYHFVVNIIPFNPGLVQNASFHDVRNSTTGLGLHTFDSGELYGSPNTLTGSIWFPNYYFPNTLVHEINHNWFMYFPDSLGFNYLFHWVHTEFDYSGFGPLDYYSNIVKAEGDTVHAYPADQYVWHYNDLELYYMGLLPSEELSKDLVYMRNPHQRGTGVDSSGNGFDIFTVDSLVTMSIEDLADLYGERTSSVDTDNFKAVFLTVYDRKLTEREIAFFHFLGKDAEQDTAHRVWSNIESNFNEAASGYAELSTKLSPIISTVTEQATTTTDFNFQIYPNPTNSELNISVPKLTNERVEIRIFNIIGQEVFNESLVLSENTKIDLSQLSSGIYILNFTNTQFSAFKKFILLK